MNLILENWTQSDMQNFNLYLQSIAKPEKVNWTRRIINTSLPLYAIPTPEIKIIAKEILKGDYLSFLKLNTRLVYENLAVNAFLIANIADFELQKSFLLPYASIVDCWALCDILKFKVNKNNVDDFFKLSMQLIKSEKVFVRRIAIIIWFELFKFEDYLDNVYAFIPNLKSENEYYVNMCLAWFVAEGFIKARQKSLKLFEENVLNDFVTNKAIQKCRDSFRVDPKDKEMLLKFKRK